MELDGPMPEAPLVLPAYQRLRPVNLSVVGRGDGRGDGSSDAVVRYSLRLSAEAASTLYPGVALVSAGELFRLRAESVAYVQALAHVCEVVEHRLLRTLPPADRDALSVLRVAKLDGSGRAGAMYARLERLGVVIFLSSRRFARTADLLGRMAQALRDSHHAQPCAPGWVRELLALSRSEASRVMTVLSRLHICEEDL